MLKRASRSLNGQGTSRVPGNLLLDPGVTFLQTCPQRLDGFPTQFLGNEAVIGVSAANANWTRHVLLVQFFAGDGSYKIDELIDRDHFLGPDIDRTFEPRPRQAY